MKAYFSCDCLVVEAETDTEAYAIKAWRVVSNGSHGILKIIDSYPSTKNPLLLPCEEK
jgi:hypothetical protein